MSLAELFARKQFWAIFIMLCLVTGISLVFYKEKMKFSNTVRKFRPDNWNIEGNPENANCSGLKNGGLLTFRFQGGRVNFTTEELDAICKQFKELNNSYTIRLSQVKMVVYDEKKKFVHIAAPSTDIVSNNSDVSHNPAGSNDTKLILLWTQFFGEEHWIKTSQFKSCTSQCVITTKKDDLSHSAALIMHARDLGGLHDLPKTRQSHQRWIYYVLESPPHISLRLPEFNDIWNMTFTYRSDSDMFVGYGRLRPRDVPVADHVFREELNNIINSKQKLVAARISNCDRRSSSRISYIRELQKYMHVDFYGACGDIKCPKGGQGCEADLMKKYKFILAFENSNCRDYITEKFWNAMSSWNSVPVVMGGSSFADYLKVAPPYSFIHVEGFESPKQLAEYLTFMNDQPGYYALLHYWRKYYWQKENAWCALCDLLHNNSAYTQSYTNFHGWYNQDTCKHN